jgi:glucose-1-phosphate adenylyltransferase
MKNVVVAILGGGQGKRLSPLTLNRAKPAVPLGGKFRLIDVPISNALHANVNSIFVMTQFASASLNRHVAETYRFDAFRGGFVAILAAEQGIDDRNWYQGTADAVRQNLSWMNRYEPDDILILSGDQLYLMDLRGFVHRHRETESDLTIAVTPVSRAAAPGLGIMRVDEDGRIVEFVEKPDDPAVLDRLTPSSEALRRLGFDAPEGALLASMGIYTFKRDVMNQLLLETTTTDFGGEIIPGAIHERRVFAYAYTGYWRDIGTIPSFHQANLDLTRPLPPLNLYSRDFPIYTHPRFLPGTKINECDVHQSVLCEGSIISRSRIEHSIVGIRAIVSFGSTITRSIVMGASSFESPGAAGDVPMGIGKDCVLKDTIVDLDARIGDGVQLINADGVDEADGDGWSIRGGIVVVHQGATIPPGTVI